MLREGKMTTAQLARIAGLPTVVQVEKDLIQSGKWLSTPIGKAALNKFQNEQFDLIYIDPPYNTGKDFIYHDNYKDNLENYLKISGQIKGSTGERERALVLN